jgi:hypothetical protein
MELKNVNRNALRLIAAKLPYANAARLSSVSKNMRIITKSPLEKRKINNQYYLDILQSLGHMIKHQNKYNTGISREQLHKLKAVIIKRMHPVNLYNVKKKNMRFKAKNVKLSINGAYNNYNNVKNNSKFSVKGIKLSKRGGPRIWYSGVNNYNGSIFGINKDLKR